MSGVVQVLVDVLAIVGGWNAGGHLGQRIGLRRRRRTNRRRLVSPVPAPVPWQYQPAAFDHPVTMRRTREEIRNAR